MAAMFGGGLNRTMPNGMALPEYDDIAEEQAGHMGAPGAMFGAGPRIAAHEMLHQQSPAPAKKPGLFGRGGNGWAALGILGDALTRQPVFAQSMMQQRERERDQAEWQRRFMLQQMSKQPDRSNAAKMAAEIGLEPGTPQYGEFIKRYAFKPTILQVPNMQGGTDFTEYDPSGVGEAAPAGPPPDAIAELRADPSGAAEFDEIFGKGASAAILGGN